jgi:hypothetical protein
MKGMSFGFIAVYRGYRPTFRRKTSPSYSESKNERNKKETEASGKFVMLNTDSSFVGASVRPGHRDLYAIWDKISDAFIYYSDVICTWNSLET